MLVKLQREMSKKFNVIMDGRDIGTVVLKDAPFKFFLTATAEERANRRFKQNQEKGIDMTYEEVLESIKNRDHYDMTRPVGALKIADDAIVIDTTSLSIEQVKEEVKQIILNKKEEN